MMAKILIAFWRRLNASRVGRRIAHGAFWSLAGAVISRLANLAASVAVARALGKERFGEYGIIQSTASMFTLFAGFGLGLTATKFVAELRLKDPMRAGRILGLSSIVALVSACLIAGVLFLLAPWLATRTLAAPQLVGVLRISALLTLFTALNGAQAGALAGLEAFKVVARVNLWTGLITLPLVAGGAMWQGVNGAVWGLAAGAIVNWGLNHVALRRESTVASIPFTLKDCFSEWHVLWTFSLPALLSSMLAVPVNWFCNALLVNQPNGYAEMGVLNAANQWFYAFLFLPGVLARCTIPVLSERLGSNDRTACRKILLYSVGVNAAVVLPLVAIGCLGSRYIMGIYGTGFAQHGSVAMIAMITAGVLSLQLPVGQLTAASGRLWVEICMNLGWATIFCAGTWFAVSHGAMGYVSARLIAYLVHTIWLVGFVLWALRQPAISQKQLTGPPEPVLR